jgi:hypothetical protein
MNFRSLRNVLFLAAMLVVLGLVAIDSHSGVHAQDATPPAGSMANHPLVGTWSVNNPDGGPGVTAFTADGIVVDTEVEGGSGVGSWQPTGDTTAAFTFVIPASDAEFSGIIVIRGTAEVDASGATFTATYSVSGQLSDGSVPFAEQGQVTGTRLPVEPVEAAGTPLAGFPTWTAESPEEAGTPTS